MAASLVLALAGAAQAQSNFPNRSVALVVTVPPGGAADFVARIIGSKLTDVLGAPVVTNNRGGAGGTIAAAAVAKADPDGHTLLLNTISTHGIGPHLYPNLPYDPVKDFTPIILVAKLPLIMTVNADLPVQSVNDVIALAKARPKELAFASAGNGGAPHLAGELFKRSPAPIYCTFPTAAAARPWSTSWPGASRSCSMPCRRCCRSSPPESFVPGGCKRRAQSPAARHTHLRRARLWRHGYRAVVRHCRPRRHAAPVAQRLNAELVKILDAPDVRKSFADQGADVQGGTPEEFAQFMHTKSARWRTVVKEAGIKQD